MFYRPQERAGLQRRGWRIFSVLQMSYQRAIATLFLSSFSLSFFPTSTIAQIQAPKPSQEMVDRVFEKDDPPATPSDSEPEASICPTLQQIYFRREQAAEGLSEADEKRLRDQNSKKDKHKLFQRKIRQTKNRLRQLKQAQRQGSRNDLRSQIRELEDHLAQLQKQQDAVGFDRKLLAELKEKAEGSYEIFVDKRLARMNNKAIDEFNARQLQQAATTFAQLAAAARTRKAATAETAAIANQAVVHEAQADYVGALKLLNQIPKVERDNNSKARLLLDLGRIYEKLGNYDRAEVQYKAALQAIGQTSDANRASAHSSLGFLYNRQEKYREAIASFEKALQDFDVVRLNARPVLHRREIILNGLGRARSSLGDSSGALAAYEKALAISRKNDCQNRLAEAMALQGQGDVLRGQGQGQQALGVYQQAYDIRSASKDVAGQAETLEGIGQWYATQEQAVLAIVFYKQAVMNLEKIRQNIETLSLEEQAVYEQSVQRTYRRLVDLLFQQNRVLEAQEVVELLKLQEVHDVLKTVRDRPKNGTLYVWDKEKNLFAQFQALNSGGLVDFADAANTDDMAAMKKISRLQTINEELLLILQDNLRNISDDSALFYPVILDDRIELLLTYKTGDILRKSVDITKEELNKKQSDFLTHIHQVHINKNEKTTPAQKGKILYEILIEPLEDDLRAQDITTLIYAADNNLRYVPLGALFDGEQWLIERFKINNITAASLTDLATSSLRSGVSSVLAGAYTENGPGHSVEIRADKTIQYQGLDNAQQEAEVVTAFSSSKSILLDQKFSRQAFEQKLKSYQFLHLATHANFVAKSPEESFILMGNGKDYINMRDLGDLHLSHAELMVLSACETASSSDFDNEDAILGFGYQAQRTGLRASISTIWPVKDSSTLQLMTRLYQAIQEEKLSYVEALQQAQISLATGRSLSGEVASSDRLNPSKEVYDARYSHPYFWAPFLLIGNGL